MVRNKAEDLNSSRLVLEQWILFLVPRAEQGLCMVEEDIQAFAFDHDPSTVSYQVFVFLVFSENNVLDRLKKKRSPAGICYYNLFHAKYKRVNSI